MPGGPLNFEALVDQALSHAKGTGRNAVYCADLPPEQGGVVEQVSLDLGGQISQP